MFSNTHSDSFILAELGSRIERERLNRNITQTELAKESGISKPTLQRIEAGKSAQMKSYIRIMRGLNLIANFEALIGPAHLSPIQQLKTKKKAQRQRATGSRVKEPEDLSPWTWDEE